MTARRRRQHPWDVTNIGWDDTRRGWCGICHLATGIGTLSVPRDSTVIEECQRHLVAHHSRAEREAIAKVALSFAGSNAR
jgi:hypothetical protein